MRAHGVEPAGIPEKNMNAAARANLSTSLSGSGSSGVHPD